MLIIFWIVPLNRTSMIARTLDLRSSLFCRASFLINLTDERLNVHGLHFSVSFFLGYRLFIFRILFSGINWDFGKSSMH